MLSRRPAPVVRTALASIIAVLTLYGIALAAEWKAEVRARVADSILQINVNRIEISRNAKDEELQPQPANSAGTAFVISHDGYALTAAHVIYGDEKRTGKPRAIKDTRLAKDSIKVNRPGGAPLIATVVAVSNSTHERDIALLQIDGGHAWRPLCLRREPLPISPPEFLALGYETGKSALVPASGALRSDVGDGANYETTVPIDHGFSGGPGFAGDATVFGVARAGIPGTPKTLFVKPSDFWNDLPVHIGKGCREPNWWQRLGELPGSMATAAQSGAVLGGVTVVFLALLFWQCWVLSETQPATAPDRPHLGRERTAARLRGVSGAGEQLYASSLGGFLTWFKRHWGPYPSPHAFTFYLGAALIYPFLTIFLTWVWTGVDTSGVEGALPQLPEWRRYVQAALLLLIVAISALGGLLIRRGRNISGLIVFAGGFAVAVAAVAVAGAGAAVAAAVASAGAVAAAAAGAAAAAVASAGAVAAAGAGAAAAAGAVAGAVAVAVGIIADSRAAERRPWLFGMTWMLYWTALSIVLVWSIGSSDATDRGARRAVLVIFGILPLVNVLFDWTSLEITRWLLTLSTRRTRYRRWLWLVDLGLAFVCLIALALALTSALQFVNARSVLSGGKVLLDLDGPAGLFARLRRDPADVQNWWVYFTLFSTLIPTLVHLGLFAFSAISLRLPAPWRAWLADAYAPTHGQPCDRQTMPLAAGVYALMMIGAGIAACAGLALVIYAATFAAGAFPGFAAVLLDWAEWIARLIAQRTTGQPTLKVFDLTNAI